MGTAKSFVKGLAAGAVLAAVGALVMSMKDGGDKKTKEMKKTAKDIMDRTVTHAKKLGKLTKSSFDKVVDTTVAEYRGVKALTEDELDELKKELKSHWKDVQKIMKKQ